MLGPDVYLSPHAGKKVRKSARAFFFSRSCNPGGVTFLAGVLTARKALSH